jgi:hypothetical protein
MLIVRVISCLIHFYNTVWLFWQFWDMRFPWKLPFFSKISNTPSYIFLFIFELVIKFYTTHKNFRKSYERNFSISLIIRRIHVYFSHFLFSLEAWKTHFLKKYVEIIICFIQNHWIRLFLHLTMLVVCIKLSYTFSIFLLHSLAILTVLRYTVIMGTAI